jgi:WXG100 family type VII secretion target
MMASSYEVRQVAVKVKNIYREIEYRRIKLRNDARESSFYWKGQAGSAFQREYERIDAEIKGLLDILEGLEGRLKTLAVTIDEWEALQAAD